MRYFVLILALFVVAVVAIAGKRGSISRKTPLYVFPDMDRQLKLRPQEPNPFFANGISSQFAPEGTIPQSAPIQVGDRAVYPYEDAPVFSGRESGTTNFVADNPMPVSGVLLKRGQERYGIYCTPCHGAMGDGNGITKKLGVMGTVANLHDPRIVGLPDGELFYVITHGRNTMGPYGSQIPVADRWAIIAYLRALQWSHVGTIEDVPQEMRGALDR
jgi:mono/diheme cytochrome c family protein